LKGEEITFLVGVSCMRRKRIEAFVKNFEEEEKELIQTGVVRTRLGDR
jgi:hypothetical protein